MSNKLHIISLDIPYPPDYGGMIDVFYKLKALSSLGLEITLHCFEYGSRTPNAVLNQYCKKVIYYPRKTGFQGLNASLPYIVSSRDDKTLLLNLMQDNSSILFEGLHTTFWLNHPSLKNRIKLLRAHNIESDYYYQLGNHASSYLKKLYFYLESNRLKWYENYLSGMQHLLSISEADTRYFSKCYPNIPTSYIPAFHANEEVNIIPGHGKYCLYHGNLSVAENIKSVRYLVKEVFNDLNIPLIIAGKNPPADLINHVADHISIIANPSEQEMETLICEAHIHVLPSFQNTGMKLKLLHALFAGRFCIMNQSILDENISSAIIFAKDASAFKQHILQTMPLPFTEEAIESRKKVLKPYMNVVNGQKIIDIIQQTVKQTV